MKLNKPNIKNHITYIGWGFIGLLGTHSLYLVHRLLGLLFLLAFLYLFIWRMHRRYEQIKIAQSHFTIFKQHTLDTLLNVSHLLVNIEDTKNFYEAILSAAIDTIEHAHKGSLLLLDPVTNRYIFRTCIGYEFSELKKLTFALEDTFLYQNAEGNYTYPVIIKNVRDYDQKSLSEKDLKQLDRAGGLELLETLSAPILVDETIVAILNVDSLQAEAFSAKDQQLIHFFSTQIAIALKNRLIVEETIDHYRLDGLTEVFTRRYFETCLQKKHFNGTIKEPYAFVIFDLDDLKATNDALGHYAGDVLLKTFTQTIQGLIRDEDLFARLGGDEFVLLLNQTTMVQAHVIMQRIWQTVSKQSVTYQESVLEIRFSYGIAAAPTDGSEDKALLALADQRMYAFKATYKKNPIHLKGDPL